MNDDDRIRLATRAGDCMLDPTERAGWCIDGGDISGGEPLVVRSCAECLVEDQTSGYRRGRAGEDCPPFMSDSYRLGYQRGVVALEEAENGHDPRES